MVNFDIDDFNVIGIDPPVSVNCGLAVVNVASSIAILKEKYTLVLDKTTGAQTLEQVYNEVEKLINNYCPRAICMERQLGGGFQFGRAKLNEFVGVIKLCAYKHKVPIVEISPAHLKMIIAGHGHAPKEVIMENVAKTFGLADSGAEHECDAASFALNYFIDEGWKGYRIQSPYTDEMAKADREAKKARKKLKEERKKAKEEAGKVKNSKGRKNAKV